MAETFVRGFKCERCGHVWVPRSKGFVPVVCPKCKSPYWNRKREDIVFKTRTGKEVSFKLNGKKEVV